MTIFQLIRINKNNNGGTLYVVSKNKNIFLLLCFIFSFLTHSVSAQKNRWKDYIITGSSMLVSGMLDGTIESISYHYESGFQPHFSKINNQFWNPALSWKNKYKNGVANEGPKFVGSTNIFVGTTDAYHMLRTTKRAIDGFTLVYYVDKTCSERPIIKTKSKSWKKLATDFVILTAIRCIGFNLTYSLAFKPVKY